MPFRELPTSYRRAHDKAGGREEGGKRRSYKKKVEIWHFSHQLTLAWDIMH